MSFIHDIYQTVQAEPEKKGTFFSVVNYLVANESIKKKDMEERFALRKSYSDIMAQLHEHNIVSSDLSDNSTITLNSEAKDLLRPVLQNVLAQSYAGKYNNLAVPDTEPSPEVSILLDCRSELYKAF